MASRRRYPAFEPDKEAYHAALKQEQADTDRQTMGRFIFTSVEYFKGLPSAGKTYYAGRRAAKARRKAEKLVKRDMMKHGYKDK